VVNTPRVNNKPEVYSPVFSPTVSVPKPMEEDIKPVTVEEKIPIWAFPISVPNIEKNCEKENGKETNPRTFTFPVSSKQVYNTNVQKKEPGKHMPVIYVSGKPFVPKSKTGLEGSFVSTVEQPLYGDIHKQTPHVVSTPEQPHYGDIRKQPVVVKQQPQKESLVTVTNNLAESISSLVLESSDSTLQSSAIHSTAIGLQTEKISQQTVDDNFIIATQISSNTNQISARSEAGELDDNIRRSLSDACTETGKNSAFLSDQIAAMTNTSSRQIAEEVDPISKHTRNLQAAATEGLEEHLTQGVDALVRDIFKATSVV